MKTPWTNPFKLSKAITIKDLKLGLGIIYAGGAPSNITIGGALTIGDVQGSVLVHTGVDPSKQLIHAKIVNLDVAKMLITIGKLIDVDLTIPSGSNAFFIRKFELYLSTGLELFDVVYPRGIRLEVDMMLFGKHAKLDAEVATDAIKLKGSIEKFKIGDLVVSAASSSDRDPYIDIELSREIQSLKVDGKIVFMEDNWVMILIDIDTSNGTLHLYFELVVGDALKIVVVASLEGGLPEAEQDRASENDHQPRIGGAQQQVSGQAQITQAAQNTVLQQAGGLTHGGQLDGKTFKIHAEEVNPDIVKYLVELANHHLGGERDEARLGRLETALANAKATLDAAKVKYDAARAESDAAIEKAMKGLDKRVAEMRQDIMKEQTRKTEETARLDQEERNLVVQAAQNARNLAESEQFEVEAADEAARNAHTEVERGRARVHALQTADEAVQNANRALERAEDELATGQVALTRKEQTVPEGGPTNVEYAAWLWMRDELAEQVAIRESNAKKALNDAQVAKAALRDLDLGSLDEANTDLSTLIKEMTDADAAAKARREAIPANMAAATMKAAERRNDLQKRRAAFTANSDARIDELTRRVAAFEQERSEKLDSARTKNDVSKTDAGKVFDECLEKHRAADVKLRAYKHLKDSISSAESAILTPLRFAVNVVGKADRALNALLSIQSFMLDGSFSGKSSKVSAIVKCKIGGYDFDFSISIDLGDIVSFFSELWNKIKENIASVANALLDLARKGVEAVTQFLIEAASEVKKAVTATTDDFRNALAVHGKELELFLDDIDRSFLQPLEHAAKDAVDQIEHDLTRGILQGIS